MPIVDVHCHLCNADDVPIRGMVAARGYPGWFADFVDKILQGLARDTADGRYRIENDDDDHRIREALEEVIHNDYDELSGELDRIDSPQRDRVQRGGDAPGNIDYLRWAFLLVTSSRRLARTMVRRFDKVDLFIPLITDMEHWFDDPVTTSIQDQIVKTQRILQGEYKGKIHAFVPFDPYRQVQASRHGTAYTPLEMIKDAIDNRGFLGVKVYPAMGYVPAENSRFIPGVGIGDAFDAAFRQLCDYCQSEEVPITTHCSPGGAEPYRRSGAWGNPGFWAGVLKEFPRLHVNFAHFGGAHESLWKPAASWAWCIGELAQRYEHVYSDLSYFVYICEQERRKRYAPFFSALLQKYPVLWQRLMYGSDWHMIVPEKGQGTYFDKWQEGMHYLCEAAGVAADEVMDDINGLTALRFLGLTPGGRNRDRLRAWYSQDEQPSWLS
jgi:predicted TIM-barrel fold metal-dependent hydrolase